jgi:TPP-dependent 2-oxoacid decarboxylase
MTIPFTVAAYLKQRLEELGLDRLFGVAGNYTAPFLDTILEDGQSPIKIIGMPNEICAGYAADGYARIKGIGAVGVTYGVGAFSLLNATAGSSVEQAPVVVINGAPTNKEFLNQRYAGLLYSHMMTDANTNQKYGKPLFWAGVEIQRQGLQDRFLNLIDDTDFYFTTSVLGKSVVSEDHPRFAGVYSPSVQNPVQKIVQDAGCLIGIGAWTTGKDVNNQDILSDSVALASHGGVIVGPQFFPSVTLGDYIDALRAALKQQPLSIERYAPQRPELLALAAEDSALTYDSLSRRHRGWRSATRRRRPWA